MVRSNSKNSSTQGELFERTAGCAPAPDLAPLPRLDEVDPGNHPYEPRLFAPPHEACSDVGTPRRRPVRRDRTSYAIERPFAIVHPASSCDGESGSLRELGSRLVDDLFDGKALEECRLLPCHQNLGYVMTVGDPAPTEALVLVLSSLEHRVKAGELREGTVNKLGAYSARFVRFITNRGITCLADVDETMVSDFVEARIAASEAAPTESTRANRSWAIRRFFREARVLGLVDHDPSSTLPVDRSQRVPARPMVASCSAGPRPGLPIRPPPTYSSSGPRPMTA